MLSQLGELGPTAATSAPLVVELLSDANPAVRTQAMMTMQRFGAAAVPTILPQLDHADHRVRRAACHALGLLGPSAKEAVPKLTTLLKDADAEVRQESLATLGRMGVAAATATPALLELTHDKSASVRAAGLKALGEILADPKLARPAAVDALEDDDPLVRCRAVILLARVAPKHPDILPHLLELLKQPVGRIELLGVLGQMGPAGARAVPVVTKLLADPDANLRRQAIYALGRMGHTARSAAPALIQLLRPADFATRQAILMALRNIGGDSEQHCARPAGSGQTRYEYPHDVPAAFGRLWTQGQRRCSLARRGAAPAAVVCHGAAGRDVAPHRPERARKDAMPVLQTMLKPNGPWRMYAAMTLRRLKPDSEEAMNTLIECVKGTDVNARQQAVQFLGTLGKSARDAAPALRRTLRDPSIPLRVAAAGALWKITGETETSVPVLVKALKPSPINYARYQAADWLGQMGPAAKAALPALRKLRDDPDAALRGNVVQAIQRINAPANTTKTP